MTPTLHSLQECSAGLSHNPHDCLVPTAAPVAAAVGSVADASAVDVDVAVARAEDVAGAGAGVDVVVLCVGVVVVHMRVGG